MDEVVLTGTPSEIGEHSGTDTTCPNPNFLLADAAGAIAVVEASPDEVLATSPDGVGVITNHFQSSTMVTHEPEDEGRANSDAGRSALNDWVDDSSTRIALDELQDTLADPETDVCACATPQDAS